MPTRFNAVNCRICSGINVMKLSLKSNSSTDFNVSMPEIKIRLSEGDGGNSWSYLSHLPVNFDAFLMLLKCTVLEWISTLVYDVYDWMIDSGVLHEV